MTGPIGLILHVVHVLCGVFWVGAALMIAGFVSPALRVLGPHGGKFMQHMMGPGRFGVFMTSSSVLVVVSGLAMLVGSGAGLGTWLGSGFGRAIIAGSVAGLVAMVSGLMVNAPTAARLARLGREIEAAGGPPRPEQLAAVGRQQKRLHAAGIASALLLSFSVLAMAAARHL